MPVDMNKKYASTSWCVQDVLDLAARMNIKMTRRRAEKFLIENQNQIVQDMVARGWDSMDTLLSMENHAAKK